MNIAITLVAVISGLLFGYYEGVMTGILPAIEKEFQTSDFTLGFITAGVPLGAILSSLFAGEYAQSNGRIKGVRLTAIFFTVGSIITGVSYLLGVFIVGRLVLGLAIGCASVVVPMYIAETAPVKIRGALISYFQLTITIGILIAYIMDDYYPKIQVWQLLFLVGIFPAALLLFASYFIPESPRWLLLMGDTKNAHRILVSLYGEGDHEDKIEKEINEVLEDEHHDKGRWLDLLKPNARLPLFIGTGLFFLQQISGMNIVIYYAPIIFRQLNWGGEESEVLATIGVGVVNVIMTGVAILFIDRLGRRKLLLPGTFFCAISLIMIGVGSQSSHEMMETMSGIGVWFYIAVTAISLGPIPYVIAAEIFPLNLRSRGMALSSLSNWVFGFLTVLTYPVMISWIGFANVFYFYAACCLIGLVLCYYYVPETKGKSLEEIEHPH